MKKITTALATSILLASGAVQSAAVTYEDPTPSVGISYEWMVHMNQHDKAEMVGAVGGKASYEPKFEAPNIGWTHTSNWIALMIHQPSLVGIKVTNQKGVILTNIDREDGSVSYSKAGDMLYPGVSVYAGWDDTTGSEEDSFNPRADFWSTVKYIGHQGDMMGKHTVMLHYLLEPGFYSINIGGVNALHCEESDPCFNGKHGYHATIKTMPVPASYGDLSSGGMSMGGDMNMGGEAMGDGAMGGEGNGEHKHGG